MFFQRIQEASREAKQDVLSLSASQRAKPSPAEPPAEEKGGELESTSELGAKVFLSDDVQEEPSDIIHRTADFLFDVWDANCTEGESQLNPYPDA